MIRDHNKIELRNRVCAGLASLDLGPSEIQRLEASDVRQDGQTGALYLRLGKLRMLQLPETVSADLLGYLEAIRGWGQNRPLIVAQGAEGRALSVVSVRRAIRAGRKPRARKHGRRKRRGSTTRQARIRRTPRGEANG